MSKKRYTDEFKIEAVRKIVEYGRPVAEVAERLDVSVQSLNYVSWKRRLEVAAGLKRISTCATAEEAEQRPTGFEARWAKEYLPIGQPWRRNWTRLTQFFEYPPDIRKVIYKTIGASFQ